VKVGILTYHRTLNYGAFLQAYSLKKYVESLGHEVEIIDYWPEWHSRIYNVIQNNHSSSLKVSILSFIRSLVLSPLYIARTKVFEKSIVQDLGVNKKVLLKNENEFYNLSCDLIIYGSDQIWRYNNFQGYKGFDAVYFAEYVSKKIKKVSYAASMGVVCDYNKKDWLVLHWNNFDSLSVREKELSILVSKLTGKNIPVVIDPVFLNSKDFWYSYISKDKLYVPTEKYILFYNLIPDSKYSRIVTKFAANKNLKVIEIIGTTSIKKIFQRNVYQTLDIKKFLFYIKNAEYVFSSSFHGVAFSILFEKQFFALDTGNQFGRVTSLLKMCELEKRAINCFDQTEVEDIDYERTRILISNKIDESKKFLQQSGL